MIFLIAIIIFNSYLNIENERYFVESIVVMTRNYSVSNISINIDSNLIIIFANYGFLRIRQGKERRH